MVIGFDASRAFIPGRTGTENYSYQLLKALAKIDNKNTYRVYVRSNPVIPTNVGIHLKNLRSELDSRLRGNDKNKWPENFQFKVISWPRLWTQGGLAQQTFKDKLDVLFVPAHTIPLIHRPGLKTVIAVHDLGSEYLPGMHRVKQRLYLGFMQRYQLKTATKIIAVSKATKEDLVKKIGIDSKKIKVVYEGYDKQLFRPIKGDLLINSLKGYDLESGKYFLFVGTVQPRKNLERLIKAFARFHLEGEKTDFAAPKLVIVGNRGWLSDEIYELPKRLGIEEKVKFLGYVPDKDLPVLYSGAVALTFPSLFEGFGLPILEAEACGCPVLTSNTSSMPEVAGPTSPRLRGVKKGAIFVNPYDVGDIVNGMIEMMDERVREGLIKAGLENVRRFSWEKCARETLEVLERL